MSKQFKQDENSLNQTFSYIAIGRKVNIIPFKHRVTNLKEVLLFIDGILWMFLLTSYINSSKDEQVTRRKIIEILVLLLILFCHWYCLACTKQTPEWVNRAIHKSRKSDFFVCSCEKYDKPPCRTFFHLCIVATFRNVVFI